MSKKNKADTRGFVYSTDPQFQFQQNDDPVQETPEPKHQKLKIRLETKQRGGKAVTVVDGFIGKENDLEQLGKQLKNFCGTGGSVKEGQVLIQGDQREKVLQWLQKNNYSNCKKI
ncbi:MAG: translation initiation factor [Bacteroidota bacterium]|nr:translation initiation factor [Bacteroidota bacterium]